ncbi:M23 family peptidase [Leifsonia sp. ku-ls]|uniref:M23 family metallopeptidase n=1 Tax=Leifsonia shinshuensis TaxID=150026 RepID=A0A7G6YHP3_9MICO|nr:M23 family metallopeptidase [Leifsonia aquatica]QNE38008.1 M23 family metallopeptidase [Leifsonia shinshuensis]RDV43209.1 M23 family peptidase [Leifsonia sp. ku-ls]
MLITRRARPVRRATFTPAPAEPRSRREALSAERSVPRRRRRSRPRSKGRPARRSLLLPLAGAVFAVTLSVATSVPAEAVQPDGALETVADTIVAGVPQAIGQTGGAAVPVNRDAPSATSEAELKAAARTDPAGTLVGNTLGPIQWPFAGDVPISDGYGSRSAPCSGCSSNHKGLDMTPGGGTKIAAIADGVVRSAEESDVGFGVNVIIDHRVNGERFASLYAHMQFGSLQVRAGDRIAAGQIIGRVGTTGASTGNHLHLEIWANGETPIDPYSWLRARAR